MTEDIKEVLECEDCLCLDETVSKTTCPYAEKINDEQCEAILCPSCYHERAMDI